MAVMLQPEGYGLQTTAVTSANPMMILRGHPQNIREWNTGLYGCAGDIGSCCYAYFCYWCFLHSLTSYMDESWCGLVCCGPHICYDAPTHFTFTAQPTNIYLLAMRAKLRGQLGIRGAIHKDICATCCCHFCVATQMYRELKIIHRW